LESAKICADGQEDLSAPYLEDIKIAKMEDKLRLVHPLNNDFFEACREKLGWSLDISQINS
jgi:NAD+ kinase